MGLPLVIIHFNGIFPYKPSILGVPPGWGFLSPSFWVTNFQKIHPPVCDTTAKCRWGKSLSNCSSSRQRRSRSSTDSWRTTAEKMGEQRLYSHNVIKMDKNGMFIHKCRMFIHWCKVLNHFRIHNRGIAWRITDIDGEKNAISMENHLCIRKTMLVGGIVGGTNIG